jgi:hypothetical protein
VSQDSADGTLYKGVFRDLANIENLDQFISTDKYLDFVKNGLSTFRYVKRDYLFRAGQFRETVYPSFLSSLLEYREKILVVGHSDIPTTRIQSQILKSFGVNKVYATNIYSDQIFSFSIPLGLTNNCDDSPLHRLFGDNSLLLAASLSADFPEFFSPTLYVNFSASNNRSERGVLLKEITKLPKTHKVIVNDPDFTTSGRVKYLADCRAINFILCPEGNGVDTHRLWETLYMGGVPIIKKNPIMTPLVDHLPVVQVDSWKQIASIDFLESEWHRIQGMSWDSGRLTLNYWKDCLLKK